MSSFLTWPASCCPSGHGATIALVEWETEQVLHHVSFKLRRISSRIASSLDFFGSPWMNTPLQSFSIIMSSTFLTFCCGAFDTVDGPGSWEENKPRVCKAALAALETVSTCNVTVQSWRLFRKKTNDSHVAEFKASDFAFAVIVVKLCIRSRSRASI